MEISEELFFDKERCDALRDLVIKAPFNMGQALEVIGTFKDFEKDSILAKKLKNLGIGTSLIAKIIAELNEDEKAYSEMSYEDLLTIREEKIKNLKVIDEAMRKINIKITNVE